ncbi:hypothetical protein [Eubacterium callanderi]|jgi:hypothetical protein|uniref:DUF7698 family protein n=1 Tax=Eubacterium callanderi TaxID=53442 RepID=UPI000C078304|nr:hypothetical protein [[Clostridium] leptum]
MINNHLIMDCMEMQQLKARYDEAKEKENSAGMEAARASYRKLSEKIESRGESYTKVYRLYEDAAERGNEYIDLHDVVWDKDVEALIASLRENGIEYFTFSSTWSSAVETAWLFTENGCTLEGLVKINGQSKAFGNEEYEKIPAYLFAVH